VLSERRAQSAGLLRQPERQSAAPGVLRQGRNRSRARHSTDAGRTLNRRVELWILQWSRADDSIRLAAAVQSFLSGITASTPTHTPPAQACFFRLEVNSWSIASLAVTPCPVCLLTLMLAGPASAAMVRVRTVEGCDQPSQRGLPGTRHRQGDRGQGASGGDRDGYAGRARHLDARHHQGISLPRCRSPRMSRPRVRARQRRHLHPVRQPHRRDGAGDHRGAATPVELAPLAADKPTTPDKPGVAKTCRRSRRATPRCARRVHDAGAYIRGLAELRGRNVEWAERAVREA